MVSDKSSNHQFIMYDVEQTQPYWAGLVNPDLTMAFIDIAKQSGKAQAVSRIGMLNSINPMWLLYGVIGAVVVYAVMTGGVLSW